MCVIKVPFSARPFTFVINITFLAFRAPATYAAALSPSTLRKSYSSLRATGDIIGRYPSSSNKVISDGSTEFIFPVYPPSIAIFLPLSFIIMSLFLRSALKIPPSIPDMPAAFMPSRRSILTIALLSLPAITIV